MSDRDNVFFAITPFNILNCIQQSKLLTNESKLVVYYRNESTLDFVKRIGANNYFSSIELLDFRSDIDDITDETPFRNLVNPNKKSKFQVKKKFYEDITDPIDFPADIFIFAPGTQLRAYLLKKNKSFGGKNILVEDGGVIYERGEASDLGIARRFLLDVFVGSWFQPEKPHGFNDSLDEIRVFYPSLVEDKFEKNVVEMDPSNLRDIDTEDFELEIEENRLLVAPLKYKLKNKGILSEFKQLVGSIPSDEVRVKYHPDEDEEWLDNFKSLGMQEYPLEIVYMEAELSQIIGFKSTALYTAKMISDTAVVSLINILEEEEQYNLIELFDKSGIEMPENTEEFENCIPRI